MYQDFSKRFGSPSHMVKMKESEAEDSIDFCVYVEICFKVLLSCKRVEDKSEEKMYMLDQFSNGENS